MLQIMLCGAHDVHGLKQSFYTVATDFGAHPLWYKDGNIYYANSLSSKWAMNSRMSVKKVDACVFVLLEKYGDVTWETELEEALYCGKPFIFLVLDSTLQKTEFIIHKSLDSSQFSQDEEGIVSLFSLVTSKYQLTPRPFTYPTFEVVLRRGLADLFENALGLLQDRYEKESLLASLSDEQPLSVPQIERLQRIALDEYGASKMERTIALRRLAAGGVQNTQFIIDVCRSKEQGVQRLGFTLLPTLLQLPLNSDTIRELAEISAGSDDIGLSHRLVLSVGKIDPASLDILLDSLSKHEEGARRRAFEVVEMNLQLLRDAWGSSRMVRFLNVCEAESSENIDWKQRLRDLRDEFLRDEFE